MAEAAESETLRRLAEESAKKEKEARPRERSRRKPPCRGTRRGDQEGREQFEFELFEKEKEQQKEEKEEEEGKALQGAGSQGAQQDLRVHRLRSCAEDSEAGHEASAKGYEASPKGGQRELLVLKHGRELDGGRHRAPFRGDPQDPQSRDKRARCANSVHDLQHVPIVVDATRPANRGDRGRCAVHSIAIPQTGAYHRGCRHRWRENL